MRRMLNGLLRYVTINLGVDLGSAVNTYAALTVPVVRSPIRVGRKLHL
jgi:hypothetical protein